MKNSTPKILLFGNNAGNNLGDAAIMSSIFDSISKRLPNAEIIVPSVRPNFIDENYGKKYNVKGVDVMPWTLSLRLFGIPVLYWMKKCDAALICDGIIFGKKLWNPAFNFLITLIALLPFAKLLNCKLICYSTGIGPFPGFWSKYFARWLINGCDLVMMREMDSTDCARAIGVTAPIEQTGDAAFINPVSAPARGLEVLRKENIPMDKPILGINLTKYLDGWLYGKGEKVESKEAFVSGIADGVRKANEALGNAFLPVVYSTHPMDDKICWELATALNTRVISNSHYLSHDIQAAMAKSDLFLGMRFHSLILASAVGAPIVGLLYAPKVKGYFRLLGTPELGVELAKASKEKISEVIISSWKNREAIAKIQQVVVNEQKRLAEHAADLLVERIYPELKKTAQKAAA